MTLVQAAAAAVAAERLVKDPKEWICSMSEWGQPRQRSRIAKPYRRCWRCCSGLSRRLRDIRGYQMKKGGKEQHLVEAAAAGAAAQRVLPGPQHLGAARALPAGREADDGLKGRAVAALRRRPPNANC